MAVGNTGLGEVNRGVGADGEEGLGLNPGALQLFQAQAWEAGRSQPRRLGGGPGWCGHAAKGDRASRRWQLWPVLLRSPVDAIWLSNVGHCDLEQGSFRALVGACLEQSPSFRGQRKGLGGHGPREELALQRSFAVRGAGLWLREHTRPGEGSVVFKDGRIYSRLVCWREWPR